MVVSVSSRSTFFPASLQFSAVLSSYPIWSWHGPELGLLQWLTQPPPHFPGGSFWIHIRAHWSTGHWSHTELEVYQVRIFFLNRAGASCCWYLPNRYPFFHAAIWVISVLISLAIGLLPGIDNFAHVGGFIQGIIGACVLLPFPLETGCKCCLEAPLYIQIFLPMVGQPTPSGKKRWTLTLVCIPIDILLIIGAFLAWYLGTFLPHSSPIYMRADLASSPTQSCSCWPMVLLLSLGCLSSIFFMVLKTLKSAQPTDCWFDCKKNKFK